MRSTPELRVNAHGVSLHAAVRWRADQRLELKQLCRYITAIERRRLAGPVVLQLKSPYKDGTTHIVMEPLEFMERLAALVPRPRLHLISNSPFPWCAGAQREAASVKSSQSGQSEPRARIPHAQGAPPRMSWARLLKRVFDIEHCPNCGGSLKSIAALSLVEGPPSKIRR